MVRLNSVPEEVNIQKSGGGAPGIGESIEGVSEHGHLVGEGRHAKRSLILERNTINFKMGENNL